MKKRKKTKNKNQTMNSLVFIYGSRGVIVRPLYIFVYKLFSS